MPRANLNWGISKNLLLNPIAVFALCSESSCTLCTLWFLRTRRLALEPLATFFRGAYWPGRNWRAGFYAAAFGACLVRYKDADWEGKTESGRVKLPSGFHNSWRFKEASRINGVGFRIRIAAGANSPGRRAFAGGIADFGFQSAGSFGDKIEPEIRV